MRLMHANHELINACAASSREQMLSPIAQREPTTTATRCKGRSVAGSPVVDLSEVAELARLKPIQYQLEGARADTGITGEGVLQRTDREEHQGDQPR